MTAVNDDIFKLGSLTHGDGVITAALSINSDCSILRGHFPGQPVVPGACMLQVVKEVLESVLKYPLRLKKGNNLKFVGMMAHSADNAGTLELSYKVNDAEIAVNARLSDGDRLCFKFQGTFNRD